MGLIPIHAKRSAQHGRPPSERIADAIADAARATILFTAQLPAPSIQVVTDFVRAALNIAISTGDAAMEF